MAATSSYSVSYTVTVTLSPCDTVTVNPQHSQITMFTDLSVTLRWNTSEPPGKGHSSYIIIVTIIIIITIILGQPNC